MITQARLKKILNYDPETGIFTWKVYRNRQARQGDKAGSICANGYVNIGIAGTSYKAHRLAFLYMEGKLPTYFEQVDHIDGIRANNIWSNLRLATHNQNMHNTKLNKANKTGVKGLSIKVNGKTKYYVARVNFEKKRIAKYYPFNAYPSSEDAKQEAINWLQETRERLHKEFVNHG